MKQKVTVVVEPAPQGWPRVFGSEKEATDAGAQFFVNTLGEWVFLSRVLGGDESASLDSRPMFDFAGNTIGFPDFESAARWWLDPKPISGDPAPVPVLTMKAGDYFIYLGCLFVDMGDSYLRLSPSLGTTKIVGSALVTPFHGTVTITVSPE